jgi:hypothetical protein
MTDTQPTENLRILIRRLRIALIELVDAEEALSTGENPQTECAMLSGKMKAARDTIIDSLQEV